MDAANKKLLRMAAREPLKLLVTEHPYRRFLVRHRKWLYSLHPLCWKPHKSTVYGVTHITLGPVHVWYGTESHDGRKARGVAWR